MTKAPNIFKQFVYAFVPPKYRELAKVKTGSMIGFVTLLVFVSLVLNFASFMLRYNQMGGASGLVRDIPDFEVKNGKLTIEKTYELDEADSYILITDEIASFNKDDVKQLKGKKDYQMVLLISQSNICLYNNGRYQDFELKSLAIEKLNKEWITNTLIPVIMIILMIGYVLAFIFQILLYFAAAAIYLLIAMLIASVSGKDIPAGSLFRAAVYSKVLMFVIASLMSLIPAVHVGIPFPLRVGITIIILVAAIQFMEQPYSETFNGSGTYNGADSQ